MDRLAQTPGERPRQDKGVKVLNPQTRVPISFNIDDSTCLVSLYHLKRYLVRSSSNPIYGFVIEMGLLSALTSPRAKPRWSFILDDIEELKETKK